MRVLRFVRLMRIILGVREMAMTKIFETCDCDDCSVCSKTRDVHNAIQAVHVYAAAGRAVDATSAALVAAVLVSATDIAHFVAVFTRMNPYV